MDIAKRIGAAILGFLEGYFLGGLIIGAMNNASGFQGSILWGVIGAVIGALFPISTLLLFILLIPAFYREGKDD